MSKSLLQEGKLPDDCKVATVTPNLKSQEKYPVVKKAQSLLGMVKKHFKDLDKEDFMIIYNT